MPADTAHHSGGLPALVARHASNCPQALAVVDGDTALTYAQLVAAAGHLTATLRDRGVRPGDAVGLLTARSARTVVAQLALWQAGAVCVPLDAAHPRPRTATVLADARAEVVCGDKQLLEAAGIPAEQVLELPGGDLVPPGAAEVPEPPRVAHQPDAPAMVMFTSGSTGRPKGVAVTHRGIADLVTAPGYVTVGPRDRVLFHSPATFDASTFEIWTALANGAAVVVCTAPRPSLEDLARTVEQHGATVAFFTTALFHQLAARRSRLFQVLRTVVVGGEALSAEHARTVLRAVPWLELVNGYGPTETATFATAHRVTDADCDAPPPIGRPVAGATAHVLDAHGQPVPGGARGELWIGGPRLAAGYVAQPELTAERFVQHPGHGRLYRTGDLVTARADGTLDFHGRTDDQVKVRGFRIEPGEIEHALRAQPEVDDAAVTVRRISSEDARLTAFLVPAEHTSPRPEALRARLTEQLPAHLVPEEWVVVDRLPLTASGKVDRRALAESAPGQAPVSPVSAALSPIEQAVAEVWSHSLECEVTAPDADFLALGGHSLLVLAVVDDLREALGVEIPLADFFANPTVAGQAALVERSLLATHGDPLAEAHGAPAPDAHGDPAPDALPEDTDGQH
ncbi:non-ribosomal peptide synthetase [Streptomyces iconiensis]|uniref:Non-ribosomal peptide synthetase n=1 Tax=Streptomyces iconiensis TaxID=1384038 RepID=A0ABT7A7K5_9ACTN|nr:non-ribosomal peptide synthetase [Streptomyces iconiensis]MDJ1137004.1 non-ribosomal peptide synthetase [Streptomyces iconiensis]